ncbi:uncharacterized protein LOC106014077, partial [Aplysia californica]|uniref:Uncharacterized protein LOC106014077 n=1 Tax=Aplysia californica TaxID=6500 RepID=A0ABM1AFB5_APLCA
SPVTALKNEIDRRLAMTNGVDIPPPTLEEEKVDFYYEQQRQSLLNNFTASFNLPPQQEGGDNGMYIYGPSPTRSGGGNPLEEEAALYAEEHMHQQQQQRGRDPNRHGGRAEIGGHSQESSQGHRGRGQTRVLNSHHLSAHRSQSGDRNGGGVPRYQNDSPFQREPQEPSPRQSQRLESLMCLDRSHIHDDTLRETTWYQAGLPRDIAMEILQQ